MSEQAVPLEPLAILPLLDHSEIFPEAILLDVCGALRALNTDHLLRDDKFSAMSQLRALATQQGVGMHEWRMLVMQTNNAQVKINDGE